MKVLFFLFFSLTVSAETVKLGQYSGKPGYYVKIGEGDKVQMDALLMSADVVKSAQKLNYNHLGELKICEVEGFIQASVFSVFKIKSCK
jgi:hypothetical protein